MAEIDGKVYLPREVRARIAAGDAQLKAATGQGYNAEPGLSLATGAGDFSQAATAAVNPPVEQAPPPPPAEQAPPPAEQAPPPPPAEQASSEPAGEQPPTEQKDELGRVRHAYNTLKGKYNTEVPRLQAALQKANETVSDLQRQVALLTARVATGETPPENKGLTPSTVSASITDDEVREFGPDLIDVIGRKAAEIAGRIVAEQTKDLRAQVEALGGSVKTLGRAASLTAKERFEQYMDNHVSGWREQDDDPLFKDWLDKEDPFSGVVRMVALRQHMARENWQGVALIFQGYVNEQAAIAQPGRRSNGSTATRKVPLETLVAPGGTRGRTEAIEPSGNAPQAHPTYDEVRQFYRKLGRPNHGMSEAEVAAMERRIIAAVNAGAIQAQPGY